MTDTRAIAVRSLRRRLWRALQQEDVETAIRAYTATRADYETWLLEEQARLEQEKQARQQQQESSSKKAFQKLKSLKLRRRSSSSKQNPIAEQANYFHQWDDDDYLLIQEMDPSNVFVADDLLSPDDPYETNETLGIQEAYTRASLHRHRRRSSRNRGPRLAGFFTNIRGSRDDDESDDDNEEEEGDDSDDDWFTTPLHEAARLGSGKLVRLFLEHGGLPNLKNGKQRTALHMAAGGLTVEEEDLLLARAAEETQGSTVLENIGIRAPVVNSPHVEAGDCEDHPAAMGAKRAAMAVRRLFTLGDDQDKNEEVDVKGENPRPPLDARRLNQLIAQRMDTVLAILSWSHQEDGSGAACEGPSINSVDIRGRTALHYAAELGRSDICIAVVSSFGAILTIVDESSQTPCELAGEQGYDVLAAMLEARAVLHADPYGVDDELMASVLNREGEEGIDPDSARNKLAVPFSWYETLSTVQVRQERISIVETAMVQMQKALVEREEQEKANKVMFNCNVNDSLDSVCVGTPENEANENQDDHRSDTMVEIDEFHPPSPPLKHADKAVADPTQQHEEMMEKQSPRSDTGYSCLLKSLQESHVEMFLTFHKWKLDVAMSEFGNDPFKALINAGVKIEITESIVKEHEPIPQTCLICCEEFAPDSTEWRTLRGCSHGFCAECLSDYIVDSCRSRTGGIFITCPHHECDVPLKQIELQSLVPSPTVYESLLEAADENFVASSSDLKFCPHPGCEGIVRRLVPPIVSQEGYDLDIANATGAVCVACPEVGEDAPLTYEGVRDERYVMTRGATEPHAAHRFCFACGEENIHWPATCETLDKWNAKIRDELDEVDSESERDHDENFEDVAQRLWLKANTQPCPKCKAPIQKNEGCNHMTCTNRHCRHEFCWICGKDWKLHNSDTGGFFRCNRWEGDNNHEFYDDEDHPRRADNSDGEPSEENETGYGSALHNTRVAAKKATEMDRFLHHYSRWCAHKESAALERNMANTVCSRLAPVVEAAIEFNGAADFNFGGKGLSFVHAAFSELLECRSFLQHSYAFAFFRYPTLYFVRRNRIVKLRQREKATFEQFQVELEMMTEQMSDIVARTHLRATQTQIMFLTSEAAEKRRDFSSFIITALADERREKAETERKENGVVAAPRIAPPPLDVSSILERLHSDIPLRNEHDDMNGGNDDRSGARYEHVSDENDGFDDAAIQEALQASLLESFSAEANSLSAEAENGVEESDALAVDWWECQACTFLNNSHESSCAMCGTARNEEQDDDGLSGSE